MTIEEAIARQVGQCGYTDCPYLLIPGNVWKLLSGGERRAVKSRGYGGHGSHGLCIRHTSIAAREGTVETFARNPKSRLTEEQLSAWMQRLEPVRCVGPDCVKLVVVKRRWTQVSAGDRSALMDRGLTSHETRGLCYSCYAKIKAAGTVGDYPERRSNTPVVDRFDVPALWAAMKDDGGTIDELAEQLSITPERTRQIFKQLGMELPAHGNRLRQEAKMEEITFLHSCGTGIHEIATKLGMTDVELIEYVRGRRVAGVTTLDLQYADKLEQVQLTHA